MDTSRQDERKISYDDDFYSWTREQVALLRAGRLDQADVPNIIEEIESLGRSELSALRSSYRLIAMHLLKLVHQPSHQSTNWRTTIVRERGNVEDLLLDNPGLRPKRSEALSRAYQAARREAASETALPLATFPSICPFTLEEIEAHSFWPDADPATDK